jgi:hypothetical protein
MQTEQATAILASLLGTPPRFRTFSLSKAAVARVGALEELLEEYLEKVGRTPDFAGALVKLEAAYRLLGVDPPAACAEDLVEWRHPVLVTIDNKDPVAEADAWRCLLTEWMK